MSEQLTDAEVASHVVIDPIILSSPTFFMILPFL
jgi:hypothetical protein